MFSTIKQRLLLGIYIFILLSIPVGAYLASQSQTTKSSASGQKTVKKYALVTPRPTASAIKQLLDQSAQNASLQPTPSPTPTPSETTIATSYGPTLSLTAGLEGRPKENQATRLFVGIMEGSLTTNPKFLLSFTVDLPASGKYSGLSLAGLNPGSNYTALLKGSAQIASSVSFTMSPAATNLNDGNAVNLFSGDLNDDNVINNTDYGILQKVLGSTVRSSNWNENADLNKDGIVNVFDLGILTKNIGKTGASGAWTSPISKLATPSAGLNTAVGSPSENSSGYWLWLPK